MKKFFLIMISIMMIASMWMPVSAEETDISTNTQTQESEESSSQTTNENDEITADQDSKTDEEDVISEETDSDSDVTGETEVDEAVEDEVKEETEVEQKPDEEVIDDSDKDISLFNDALSPSEDGYHVYDQNSFIDALNAISQNKVSSTIVLDNIIVFNKPIVIDNLELTIDFKGNSLFMSNDFSCEDSDTCSFIDIKNRSSITFINKSLIRHVDSDGKQHDVISSIGTSEIDCLDSIIAIDGSKLDIEGYFNIMSTHMETGPKDSTVLLIKGSEVSLSGVKDDYGEVKGKVILSNSSNATSAIRMDGKSKLEFDQIYVMQHDQTMGASDLKPFILVDEIDISSKDTIIDVSKAQLDIEGSFVESANSDIDINSLIITGSSSESNVLKSKDGTISIVGYDSCVYGDCRSIRNRLTGGGETFYLPDDQETKELINKLADEGEAPTTIDLDANYIIDYKKNGFIVVNGNKTLDTNAYNISSTLTDMPDNSDLAFIIVSPGASLNIQSGQAVADGRIILKSTGQSSNRSYTILNLGTLTIDGVEVSNFSNSENAIVIQNGIDDAVMVNGKQYTPGDSQVSFNLKRGSAVGNIENIDDVPLSLTGGTISDVELVDYFKNSKGILLKKERETNIDTTTSYAMINEANSNNPLFDWLDNQFLHTFGTYGSLHSDARMTTITFLSISDSYVDNGNYFGSIPEEDRFYGLTFVNEVEGVTINIGNLELDYGERDVFEKTSEEYDIGNGGDDILGCADGEDGIYIDNKGKTIVFGEDYSVDPDLLTTRYNVQFGIKIDDSLQKGQEIEIDTVFMTETGEELNIKLYLEREDEKTVKFYLADQDNEQNSSTTINENGYYRLFLHLNISRSQERTHINIYSSLSDSGFKGNCVVGIGGLDLSCSDGIDYPISDYKEINNQIKYLSSVIIKPDAEMSDTIYLFKNEPSEIAIVDYDDDNLNDKFGRAISISDAMKGAKNSNEDHARIILLSDTTLDSQQVIDTDDKLTKGVVLELDGNTLTIPSSIDQGDSGIDIIGENTNVTIRNGTIIYEGSDQLTHGISVRDDANLTLEDVTIISRTSGTPILADGADLYFPSSSVTTISTNDATDAAIELTNNAQMIMVEDAVLLAEGPKQSIVINDLTDNDHPYVEIKKGAIFDFEGDEERGGAVIYAYDGTGYADVKQQAIKAIHIDFQHKKLDECGGKFAYILKGSKKPIKNVKADEQKLDELVKNINKEADLSELFKDQDLDPIIQEYLLADADSTDMELGSIPLSLESDSPDINAIKDDNEVQAINGELVNLVDIGISLKRDSSMGAAVSAQLNELPEEVEFDIYLPESDFEDGAEYKVVRVHDGEVDVLDTEIGEFDPTKGYELGFKTDRFSTYGVIKISDTSPSRPEDPSRPSIPSDVKVDIKDGLDYSVPTDVKEVLSDELDELLVEIDDEKSYSDSSVKNKITKDTFDAIKKAVQDDKNLTIRLVISNLTPTSDQRVVNDAVGYKNVKRFLDITVEILADGKVIGNLEELDHKIAIEVKGLDQDKTYQVYRVDDLRLRYVDQLEDRDGDGVFEFYTSHASSTFTIVIGDRSVTIVETSCK